MPKEKSDSDIISMFLKTGYQLGALETVLNKILNPQQDGIISIFGTENRLQLLYEMFKAELMQLDQQYSDHTIITANLDLEPLISPITAVRNKEPELFKAILEVVKQYSELAKIVDMALQESSDIHNELENNSNQDNTNLKHSDTKPNDKDNHDNSHKQIKGKIDTQDHSNENNNNDNSFTQQELLLIHTQNVSDVRRQEEDSDIESISSEEPTRPSWLLNINEDRNDTNQEALAQGSVLYNSLDDIS